MNRTLWRRGLCASGGLFHSNGVPGPTVSCDSRSSSSGWSAVVQNPCFISTPEMRRDTRAVSSEFADSRVPAQSIRDLWGESGTGTSLSPSFWFPLSVSFHRWSIFSVVSPGGQTKVLPAVKFQTCLIATRQVATQ
jgi:hypothetical protein